MQRRTFNSIWESTHVVRTALTNCESKVTLSERSYARGQAGHLAEFCPGRRFLVILETPGQLASILQVNSTLESLETQERDDVLRAFVWRHSIYV